MLEGLSLNCSSSWLSSRMNRKLIRPKYEIRKSSLLRAERSRKQSGLKLKKEKSS
jgi:hypothetical protein